MLLEAPDHIYASLAQAMAAKRDTCAWDLYFAPLAGSCSMFSTPGFQPQNVMLRYYFDHPEEIPDAARAKAAQMLKSVRSAGPPAIDYVTKMSSRSEAIFAAAGAQRDRGSVDRRRAKALGAGGVAAKDRHAA